jgi:type I restriction enzyme M protein
MAWVSTGIDSVFKLERRGAGAVGLFGEADRRLAALIAEVDQAQSAEQAVSLFDACLDRYSHQLGESGDYYTPQCIARLMAGLAGPRAGERVLDPVCGSGRLLVEAAQWARRQLDGSGVPLAYGRDISAEARRVAAMNLVLNSVSADLGVGAVDSLRGGSTGLAADVVLANPPFKMPGWGYGELIGDRRWSLGQPSKGSANYAWVQHVLSELSPQGRAVVLLADGAARSTRSDEKQIRQRIVETDVLAGVVALPTGLFPHTRIGASLWFLSKDKSPHAGWGRCSRIGEVLFVDARRLAKRADRGRRHLPDEDVMRICQIFEAWRGAGAADGANEDSVERLSWCSSVRHVEIEAHGYDLTPGNYVRSPLSANYSSAQNTAKSPREELYGRFEDSARINEQLRAVLRET